VLLRQDRGRAGHVRGRHGGAAQRDVPVAAFAPVGEAGAGRDDLHARRDDLRLERGVVHPRPLAGEAGEHVLVVDRAHRQRGVGAGGGGDRLRAVAAVVAGRDDEQGAVFGGQPLDRDLQRVVGGGVRAAQAQVDDLRAGLRGPLHPGQDRRLRAERALAHLAHQQFRARRDPGVAAAGGHAGAGDGRRHVRAVPVGVPHAGLGREVLRGGHLPAQVRVGVVDPGVQHGDRDARPGEAGLPRGGGADLLDTHVQAGPAHPVQPDASGAAVRGPEVGRALLGLAHGHRVQRGQRTGHRRVRPGLLSILDDQRDVGPARVTVPVPQQRGHVEQPLVELPGAHGGPRVAGHHQQRVAGRGGGEVHVLTARRRLHLRHEPRSDTPHGHVVPGDERDRAEELAGRARRALRLPRNR
jgi:hypothetical protein